MMELPDLLIGYCETEDDLVEYHKPSMLDLGFMKVPLIMYECRSCGSTKAYITIYNRTFEYFERED